jgi:hypothetical protein
MVTARRMGCLLSPACLLGCRVIAAARRDAWPGGPRRWCLLAIVPVHTRYLMPLIPSLVPPARSRSSNGGGVSLARRPAGGGPLRSLLARAAFAGYQMTRWGRYRRPQPSATASGWRG